MKKPFALAVMIVALAPLLLAPECRAPTLPTPDPSTSCADVGAACTITGEGDTCCPSSFCLYAPGAAAPTCCLGVGRPCTGDGQCCNECVNGVCIDEGCDPGVGQPENAPCASNADCSSCLCDDEVGHICVGN